MYQSLDSIGLVRCFRPRRPARGFTLVELLVVIAIIGVLVALLLPAVQAAREAARRTQCSNNLKQMGLACQNFSDTFQHLPASRIWDHWATWAVQILPYMEQKNLYDQWNMQDQYYNQTKAARETSVAGYFCPSRRRSPQVSTSGDKADNGTPTSNETPGACSDYAGSSGDFSWRGVPGGWLDGTMANGVIITGEYTSKPSATIITQWRGRVRLSSITDGLSNTFLIGEKQVPLGQFTKGVGDGSVYNGDHEWNYSRVAGPGFGITRSPQDTTQWKNAFGSYHPSVCQFVFVDGSVHMIRQNIDTTTLSRLSVRDDGFPVPSYE